MIDEFKDLEDNINNAGNGCMVIILAAIIFTIYLMIF